MLFSLTSLRDKVWIFFILKTLSCFYLTCLDNIREDSLRCIYPDFIMWKERKTRTVKLEKRDPDSCPVIVGEVKKSTQRMRTVKSKEKIRTATSDSKCLTTTTCETFGNVMRLCVNLMPVLAAAKDPVEEEVEKEEDKSCTSEKEPETGSKSDPFVTKSVEQTLDLGHFYTGLSLDTDTKQSLRPGFVLPPITHPKPAAECQDRQKTKSSEQTRTICTNFPVKACRGDRLIGGQEPDNRIDNGLFSKSRSAEFHLPDISLSSLEALLQTVTQKLRKRRGLDEAPWRHVQSDHLLMAVNERRLSEKRVGRHTDSCTAYRNTANMTICEAVKERPECGRRVNRQRKLPPLFSAPTPALILTMTKKNLPMPCTLQR